MLYIGTASIPIPSTRVDSPLPSTVVASLSSGVMRPATAAGATIAAPRAASASSVGASKWSPWMSVTSTRLTFSSTGDRSAPPTGSNAIRLPPASSTKLACSIGCTVTSPRSDSTTFVSSPRASAAARHRTRAEIQRISSLHVCLPASSLAASRLRVPGQFQPRHAATAVVTVLEHQRAVVRLGDLAREHEADAGSAGLRREERDEQVVRAGQSRAVVQDLEPQCVRVQAPAHADLPFRPRGVDRVLRQVDDELLDLVRVDGDDRVFALDRDAGA